MTTPLVLIGLPSYDGWIRHEVGIFLSNVPARNVLVKHHMPTDIARNALVMDARRRNAAVLFMLDADADPMRGTFAELLRVVLREPCVIGAPYCAAGGNVCVFDPPLPVENTKWAPGVISDGMAIHPSEAVKRLGVQSVNNIGTHCVAYHMGVFDRVAPPWFEYTTDATRSVLMDSEDIVGHRRLRAAGVPIYCHWDYWATHWKERPIRKPDTLTPEQMIALPDIGRLFAEV